LRPQKQFGQNFLVSRSVLDDIVAAAHLSNDDVVVEVGPGLGVLTEALATKAGKVIAIEVDRGLATALREKLKSSTNVIVLERDILEVSSEELVRLVGLVAPPVYKVVANLPYYISSAVINHFLGSTQKPGLMLVTVQKEVGKVISAKPGEMSFLSVLVQFYAKPTIVRVVPAGCFYPTPKVDSVVLRLELWSEPPVTVSDVEDFFRFVKCGFRAPRKQIRNPLSTCLGMNPSRVGAMLIDAGVDPVRRAETVSIHEWAIMYARFAADADYQSARQAEHGSRGTRKTPGRLP
jgi:16S rRNA (adenine1518-N6/adenine1519-N6)-dimethyltransferase